MSRELFLHIGSPKTGTTAIQHFLTDNRARLGAQGILYPVGGAYRAAHHILGAATFPGRASILAGVQPKEALDRAIDAILREIEAARPRKLVLSTEYLWGNLATGKIRRLLEPFADWQINLVVYLRRQDLLAQSLYLQAVKGGYARPFGEWLGHALDGAKAGFFYDQVLGAWRDCGLPVTVRARVYEKAQLAGDIRHDFMQTVAPEAAVDSPREGQQVNTTPDMETIAILLLLNGKLDDSEHTSRLRRRILTQAPARAIFAPLSYFGAGESASFMKQFEECNARVARTYLGSDDGVLFREPVREGGDATVTPDQVLARLVDMLPSLIALPPRKGIAEPAPAKTR